MRTLLEQWNHTELEQADLQHAPTPKDKWKENEIQGTRIRLHSDIHTCIYEDCLKNIFYLKALQVH